MVINILLRVNSTWLEAVTLCHRKVNVCPATLSVDLHGYHWELYGGQRVKRLNTQPIHMETTEN